MVVFYGMPVSKSPCAVYSSWGCCVGARVIQGVLEAHLGYA